MEGRSAGSDKTLSKRRLARGYHLIKLILINKKGVGCDFGILDDDVWL
jgi:hypothetical protein